MFKHFLIALAAVAAFTASTAQARTECSDTLRDELAAEFGVPEAFMDDCWRESGVYAFDFYSTYLFVTCDTGHCDISITDDGTDVRIKRIDNSRQWNETARFPGKADRYQWIHVNGTTADDTILFDLSDCPETYTFLDDGDDVFVGTCGPDDVNAGNGDDFVLGGDGDDYLVGWGGNDALFGEGGDDELHGKNDEDFITGGDGDDLIYGGNHDDLLNGDAGADTIHGEHGSDVIDGGPGHDDLSGGDDADVMNGAGGWDVMDGNGGNDWMSGGSGNDEMFGGGGSDILFGRNGDDTIRGEDGADAVIGGNHDDDLFGNGGSDILWGGTGEDSVSGGSGDDVCGGENESGCQVNLDSDTKGDIRDVMDAGDSLIADLAELNDDAWAFSEDLVSNVPFGSVTDWTLGALWWCEGARVDAINGFLGVGAAMEDWLMGL